MRKQADTKFTNTNINTRNVSPYVASHQSDHHVLVAVKHGSLVLAGVDQLTRQTLPTNGPAGDEACNTTTHSSQCLSGCFSLTAVNVSEKL